MFFPKLHRSPEERLQAARERQATYLVKALPGKINEAKAQGEVHLLLTSIDWTPWRLSFRDGRVETDPWQMAGLLAQRVLPPGIQFEARRAPVELRGGERVTLDLLIITWPQNDP